MDVLDVRETKHGNMTRERMYREVRADRLQGPWCYLRRSKEEERWVELSQVACGMRKEKNARQR